MKFVRKKIRLFKKKSYRIIKKKKTFSPDEQIETTKKKKTPRFSLKRPFFNGPSARWKNKTALSIRSELEELWVHDFTVDMAKVKTARGVSK